MNTFIQKLDYLNFEKAGKELYWEYQGKISLSQKYLIILLCK